MDTPIYIYIYIYIHILLTAAPEDSRPHQSSMAVPLLLEPPPWCLGVFFGSPGIVHNSEAPNMCLEVTDVAQKALQTSAESNFELSGGRSWTGFSWNGCNIESVHACLCLQHIWRAVNWAYTLAWGAIFARMRF